MLAQSIHDESVWDSWELAKMLVNTTRYFSGSIDHWEFTSTDSLDDVVLRCIHQLKERANIDHIDLLGQDGEVRLLLKRHIGNRTSVYCIPLRPILSLRWKSPALFHILFSFVKSLPYINLFHIGEDRVDWLWQFLFEEESYHRENGSPFSGMPSVNFFSRYQDLFNTYESRDWRELLDKYRPRKPLYQKIKKLLLKADEIDFQTPFRIGSRDWYESMFEHWETFLIVDDEDSAFTRSYIEMLNECSNEYDIISAYQHATVEKGKVEPFEEGLAHKINCLEEFLSDLNELLRLL